MLLPPAITQVITISTITYIPQIGASYHENNGCSSHTAVQVQKVWLICLVLDTKNFRSVNADLIKSTCIIHPRPKTR